MVEKIKAFATEALKVTLSLFCALISAYLIYMLALYLGFKFVDGFFGRSHESYLMYVTVKVPFYSLLVAGFALPAIAYAVRKVKRRRTMAVAWVVVFAIIARINGDIARAFTAGVINEGEYKAVEMMVFMGVSAISLGVVAMLIYHAYWRREPKNDQKNA